MLKDMHWGIKFALVINLLIALHATAFGQDRYIENQKLNGDLIFQVNKGGVKTDVLSLDGATGIFNPKFAWFVDAKLNSGTTNGITLSIVPGAAYVPSASDLTLALRTGSATALVACSGNTAGATTCSAGNEEVGIEFVPPLTGKYRGCLYSSLWMDANSNDALSQRFALSTFTAGTTTSVDGGWDESYHYIVNVGATSVDQSDRIIICETFSLTGGVQIGLKMQNRIRAASGTPDSRLDPTPSDAIVGRFTVDYLGQ